MAANFVHLHTHSHFSLLDGAGKIDALLERAKILGMPALALTDHGAMYGILEFYEIAHKTGIKPILGMEAYMAPRSRFDKEPRLDSKAYHLVLLAENYQGYLNLIKLTSESHLDGFYYKPRIDKEILRKYSGGLIATSSCFKGEVPMALQTSYQEGQKVLKEYVDIFGKDNFLIEIQHRPEYPDYLEVTKGLKKLAKEYDLSIICTNDVHYINMDDAEAQDVLVCVSSGKTVGDPNRLNMTASDLHLASLEEMLAKFPDNPEYLENTLKIAARCEIKIPLGGSILPKYPLPPGMTDSQYLRKLCGEGVKKRYGFDYTPREDRAPGVLLESPLNDFSLPLKKRVTDRLEYELSVIEKVGYESYFLIVQDFINWAKGQRIAVGPGRGSAAGSIVGYLTGITDIDPLIHDLIFERFLNPDRIGMPDIDTDLEDARRDEVIQYVRERYGADHVAQIITFGTMAARNAIRDVGRALGVPYNECDYIAKLIPSGPGGMNLKEALAHIPELKSLYESNEQIAKLVDIASRLEGVARHTSIHAAGVVISKEPLTEYIPLQRSAKDDSAIVTQYAMNQVEHIGLLKMDFLGLSNLSIIQQALRIIRKTRNLEIDISTIPIDNKLTYDLLSRAETTGVFQLESAGVKRYLKELRPTQFEDIMSMVALYRPGPMEAIPDFIESKHGRKKISYLHPILEPILKNTYGVIVTQDQVLEIARKFAGFTYAEADILRKAVGKKIKKLLDEQREKFINGSLRNPAISQPLAKKVWDFIEPFARYGFNRAHAACYALIAYQTAYLKAHYPVEFMASLLTSDLNNLDRVGIEISECREMGLEVLPPDVNESFVEFGVVFYKEPAVHQQDSYIRFGLGAIKNVGIQPAEAIVEERKVNGPYLNFADFLQRNSPNLNKKVLENLAMSGALDSLVERQSVLDNMEIILHFSTQMNKQKNSAQINLFNGIEEGKDAYTLNLKPVEATDQKTRLLWERELLGIYLSDHPITPYTDFLPEDRLPIINLNEIENGVKVRVCGIVMNVHKILTKNNQTMAFINLEDETGMTEIILFPKIWQEKEKIMTPGQAVIVDGKTSRKASRAQEGEIEEIKILVDYCQPISEEKVTTPKKNPRQLRISLPEDGDRNLLQRIKACLDLYPGKIPVILMVPTPEGEQALTISHNIEPGERLYSQLAYLLGTERISVE